MKLTLTEPEVFKKLLVSTSRFVKRAHFDISNNGVRVRSIDPDDFCYVDIFLPRSFFNEYNPDLKASFGIDVSKFSKFMPRLTSANTISMKVKNDSLVLEADSDCRMRFSVSFLEHDPYDLPEPRNFEYEAFADIPSKEFSNLVDTASAISNELDFAISKKQFVVSASSGDYSYSGQTSKAVRIEDNGVQEVAASVIANYMRTLRGLISKCETVRVWLGSHKPVKLELLSQEGGTFCFILSHKRRRTRPKKASGRCGTSLPRLTVTRLPEFLLYLTNCPDGEETGFLREAGLETSGGDYSRMTQELKLANRSEGRIKLSKNGEIFVNLMQNDQERAKSFLHGLAFSLIGSYRAMVNALRQKILAPEDLYEEINHILKEKKEHTIDRQDLSTLLGLAIWCGVVDKKLALFYMKKR